MEKDSIPPPNNPRRKIMLSLAAGMGALALCAVVYHLFIGRYRLETNNAYVNGHVIQITAQTAGTVAEVAVDDTQAVKAGDLLVALDTANAKIALAQARANLAQTVRHVRTLYINNQTYRANLKQRQAELAKVRRDFERLQKLVRSGAVAAEELDHAENALRLAEATQQSAEEQLASNLALTDNVSIEKHPNVLAASAQLEEAYLNYSRSQIRSPVDGYIAKQAVQPGQRIAPGIPLMAVVPLAEVWVEANFKESQLKQMRVGQPVRLTADAYGSGVVYQGRIVGFSAGTGSAFSLLPAQNATGNWIKIVQRLPIRIALDRNELKRYPLRVGFSMEARVDLHEKTTQSLPMLSISRKGFSINTNLHEAQQEIRKIILQNSNHCCRMLTAAQMH